MLGLRLTKVHYYKYIKAVQEICAAFIYFIFKFASASMVFQHIY
jgi:hypothetical protein